MATITAKLFRGWRVIATGIAFSTFMVGGFVMALTAFPIVRFCSQTAEKKGRRIRGLIQISFIAFIRFMTLLGIMGKPKVEGLETLREVGPCVIIANHPTLIDVVLLFSLIPDSNCVVKRALWEHFFLGGVVKGAGYIPNDDGPKLIEGCKEGLSQGKPLVIFPEGTRSPANELHAFNRGALQIALRAGVPVVPAVITCSPPTLMKHQAWYEVPERAFQLTLKFHPVMVLPEEVLNKEELPQKVRAFTRHCEAFFARELQLDQRAIVPVQPETAPVIQ